MKTHQLFILLFLFALCSSCYKKEYLNCYSAKSIVIQKNDALMKINNSAINQTSALAQQNEALRLKIDALKKENEDLKKANDSIKN